MKQMLKRLAFLLGGVLILSLGVSLFVQSNLGADPFTSMNLGISKTLGLSLGVYQLFVNLLLLGLIFLLKREYINVGTFVNMILVGFCVDGFTWLWSRILPPVSFPAALVLVAVGCIVMGIGCGMYLASNSGISPYDAVSIYLSGRFHIPFRWVRISVDLLSVTIGFLFGATVGIGTLVSAFLSGPVMNLFMDKFTAVIYGRENVHKVTKEERRERAKADKAR